MFVIIKIGPKMRIIFFDFKLNFLAIKNDDHFLHNETIFAVTSKEGRRFEKCLKKTNNEHYG